MPRWHFHLPRRQGEQHWIRMPQEQRFAALLRADEAAEQAAAVLRSADPRPGWVSNVHSRDGKAWVCARGTQGAQPAWIWTGDIAD